MKNTEKHTIAALFRKKKPETNAAQMPPLELDEDDIPDRGSNGGTWIAVLCIALAIAMLVGSLPTGGTSSLAVNQQVRTAVPQWKQLSTSLSGAGTLEAQEPISVDIPNQVKITAAHVRNGDLVSEGDLLATVDTVSAGVAVAQLQDILAVLDADLQKKAGDAPDARITASVPGRVKSIQAQADASVGDTVSQAGSLMILSLDGLMAVQLEAAGNIGDSVTVTLSDGKTLPGRVAAFSDGISTITLSDETAPDGDSVSVADESGNLLGTGNLYIHSPLKVSGYYGTVGQVLVRKNQKVSQGTPLLQLKDVGHTEEYRQLLEKRAQLEEQMTSLIRLQTEGTITASADGLVSGIAEDVPFEPLVMRSLATPGPEGETTDPTESPSDEPTEPASSQTVTVALVTYAFGNTLQLYTSVQATVPDFGSDLTGLISSIQTAQGSVFTYDGAAPVYHSQDGEWVQGSFSEIKTGDALLIMTTDGHIDYLVYQHLLSLPEFSFPMPDFSSFFNQGNTKTPIYETYDLAQTTLLSITPQQQVTVTISVDGLDILSLHTGMSAQISLDAIADQVFPGEITKIQTAGTNDGGNGKFSVEVTLPADPRMLPGMNASVQVVTAVSESVMTLPAAALSEHAGKAFVYTAYDAKHDTLSGMQAVETGISDGMDVQILTELPENTQCYYRYADSLQYQLAP